MIASAPPRESLLRAVRSLPSAPQILAQLGRLLADPNSDLPRIAALLKRDAALSARILRISNSAIYGRAEPCASIEEAVQRVGFEELYRLTGFAATAQLSPQHLALYGVSGAQFRENALLTALVLERLAPVAGVDVASAYTAGLLRSIGKIALDRWACVYGLGLDYETHGSGPLLDWEIGIVGIGNGEAAGIVLADWQFPEAVSAAIHGHYAPPADSRLANLLSLAASAAERCGHGWRGEHFYWEPTPEKFAAAGVDTATLERVTMEALEAFGPVRAAVA